MWKDLLLLKPSHQVIRKIEARQPEQKIGKRGPVGKERMNPEGQKPNERPHTNSDDQKPRSLIVKGAEKKRGAAQT